MKIAEIVKQVQAGEIKAVDLVKKSLARARAVENHQALISLTEKRALKRAAEIDAKIAKGESIGMLAGVPFINKDNILAFDGPTTAASRMLENFEAPYQATVIEKLEAAGAICIGKANLDAFAHGSSTENSAFGPTKNAVDAAKIPGGSSGGSAVAVALDVAPFALGTDTGGSIRQPASHNGVVGYKPSYGLVSRYGAVAMASSTDCIGCFAKTAEDIDLVLSVMAGRDERDGTTYESDYHANQPVNPKAKIAVIKQFMSDQVDPAVAKSTKFAIDQIRQAGYQVDEVDLPEVKYALAIYYVVVSAEVASNLGRYDGVRYGYRTPNHANNLDKMFALSRSEAFEAENQRRIMIGNYVLSSGYFDAYYLKAQRVRTLLIQAFKRAFEQYDFLVGPVSPDVACDLGANINDPVKMYLEDLFTTPANLAGLPAVSLPTVADDNGLPIGLQVIANFDRDAELLAWSKAIEQSIRGEAA